MTESQKIEQLELRIAELIIERDLYDQRRKAAMDKAEEWREKYHELEAQTYKRHEHIRRITGGENTKYRVEKKCAHAVSVNFLDTKELPGEEQGE